MKLEMTNGDSILINLWTTWDEEEKKFREKDLHLIVENNHLFICDNGWNELLIKSIKYPTKKGSMMNTHKGLKEKLLKKKGKKHDKICIDLLSNDWCKYMRPTPMAIKKGKKSGQE